jgi:hypothetical protein
MRVVSRFSLTLWIAVLASSSSLVACASPGLFGRAVSHGAEDAAPRADGGQSLTVYLDLMKRLIDGDPVTQAETFRAVEQAAEASPTTTNRLKLALALGTPGHPASDPARAAEMLNALLASGAALLPEERTLVAVHLKEVEQRMILNAEADQIKKQAADKLAEQSTQSNRRLQAATAENEKLRKALQEAEGKLNAITNIERSIRERENGANTN